MNRYYRNIVKFWALVGSVVLWLVSLTAAAQVYKSADENEVVIFSDVPPATSPGKKSTGRKHEVSNSIPRLGPAVTTPVSARHKESAARTASIASPHDDATIPMGADIFDVTAELGAPLDNCELLTLCLDDEMVDANKQTRSGPVLV